MIWLEIENIDKSVFLTLLIMKAYDDIFIILVVGEDSVGKSTLLDRADIERFTPGYLPVIGIEPYCKFINIDLKRYVLAITLVDIETIFEAVRLVSFKDLKRHLFYLI